MSNDPVSADVATRASPREILDLAEACVQFVKRATGVELDFTPETLPVLDASEVVSDPDLGTVSIVGTGMASAPGYAALMFRTLFDHSINIELISTSDIRITCLVRSEQVPEAVRALHAAFDLDKE